jgi:hypothetical protein
VTSYRRHPLDCGEPPAWASQWGEDRFGVFAGFALLSVVIVLLIRPREKPLWVGSAAGDNAP